LKFDRTSLLLYAVTDRTWLKGRSLADAVEEAVKAGVTFLQLREKELDFKSFFELACEIKRITDKYKIPFIINDNVDVAVACGADGVHVGQNDMKATDVRKIIGRDKILGISVQTAEQAVKAEKEGADYIGVGSVFPTSTKPDAKPLSPAILKEICKAVKIPVVAIGGINKDNAISLARSGIDGVAVVSAIFAQDDITSAVKELRRILNKVVSYEV